MSAGDSGLRSTLERGIELTGIVQLTREIWCCIRGRSSRKESLNLFTPLSSSSTTAPPPPDAISSTSAVASATTTASASAITTTATTTATTSCHLPFSPDQKLICILPSPEPPFNSITAIQPEPMPCDLYERPCISFGTPLRAFSSPHSATSGQSTPILSSCAGSPVPGCGTPIHTPPLRLKTKGLLERRGSNASLTLDLGSSSACESPIVGSPPRESTAEEYLQSASNPMSCQELISSLNNSVGIHKEFWEIPMNHPDKIEVAGSGVKNRYRTILPNESTRVKLLQTSDDPLAAYINANYIRGYRGEARAYIATQGPMANTLTDFWRMIWQENVPIIVMITKLQEQNSVKCESYLPDSSSLFGDVEVVTESLRDCGSYTVRHLLLKCGAELHSVEHYWYTVWPDHKAPAAAKNLLDLVKEVEERRYDPVSGKVKGPVVVHCSAGIGRTGCFIATSIGIQQLKTERIVDILGIVSNLRLDRGGMVQTNEQYEFVHNALTLYEKEMSCGLPTDSEL
jgi:receptor-type tyrosine-protein phosphatase R